MGDSPQDILKMVFGYEHFRGEQERIIQHILRGEHALILMPTSGGKSLCYQIPALIRSGVGIVVSPLISLMEDQVNALTQQGIRAAFLNTSLSLKESKRVIDSMHRGKFDLLYVTPERLVTDRFLEFLASTRIALFAIDEAHCISQWGHQFRPEYRKLSVLYERFPTVPRIALTATADSLTRQDIITQLGLAPGEVFVGDFNRPNIYYQVVVKHNASKQLLHFLQFKHRQEAGIVYCLSQKRTELLANWLRQQGFPTLPYHAGLSRTLRKNHQAQFFERDDLIMVATVAFGMGIDKPNIRFVAHMDLPNSLETYYQETGRAGRDGLPAEAWLAFGIGDLFKQRRLLGESGGNEREWRLKKQRLNSMLGYCELTTCRRQVLLNYLGETLSEPCGYCDNCLHPVPVYDGTEIAQKALSCVYRTGQRFGVNYVIDVLLGNANERVKQFGHEQVSTFGLGKTLERTRWQSVFRQLLALGFLIVDTEGYGGLRLTEAARPLLRGERRLTLRRESENRDFFSNRHVCRIMANSSDTDEQLLSKLRAQRSKLARTQNVYEFLIFHDSVLEEMVRYQLKTLKELEKLRGVSRHQVACYGQSFVDIIGSH